MGTTDEAVDALVQASFAVTAVLTRVAVEHDLSLTLLRALGILLDHEPRMAELADHLGVERSTMSGLIDRAERRGLVERRADPEDARACVVLLTPGGRRLVSSVRPQVVEELARLLDGLAADDVSALATHLTVVVANGRGGEVVNQP